jgi:hypothetical protein
MGQAVPERVPGGMWSMSCSERTDNSDSSSAIPLGLHAHRDVSPCRLSSDRDTCPRVPPGRKKTPWPVLRAERHCDTVRTGLPVYRARSEPD